MIELGDNVTVLDRQPSSDADVVSVVGDVCSIDDQRHAAAVAAGDGESLDVVVVNAGLHDGGLRLDDGSLDDMAATFRRVLDVNAYGYLLTLACTLPFLRRSDGTAILTLSDASYGVVGNGAGLAYVAAKHADLGLLRAAARDLAPNVRVNAVAPGGVATGLRAVREQGEQPVVGDPEELEARLRERTHLRRGVTIDEVVAAYLFLASPGAGGMTGQVLRVDAGLPF
jgi:NAD(P)-dependent dehydrogenase (short-subunit alcohol dehydrogenase family)